ncbi:S49 family peptidase [Devosia ginsengisoli]|uniref:S49 family peptidase n=1 Tax=Devosia ginsengisoli TaxID=400770 RepID=UPI0026F14CFD|nr:S49 family peptidase [Devosia ginsengisoli]MCR6673238.1 S49 family peptidase [Devosia ginsengisoli]
MSGNFLPLIAQRILNRPLLIHPQMADAIYAILEGRINADAFMAAGKAPEASRFIGSGDRPDGTRRRYTRASGRTAIITIDGSLVNRGAWVGADFCTGMVSYEGIGAQIDEVAADARAGHLDNLVLDVNSYGGEATGMSALASKIGALRRIMHVVAVVNDVAASAGFGLASNADRIVVSPTSIVGSIGVVMLHLDRSGELSQKGIRPTLIHAGAKKVDGNPFGPLPENVRADMTRDVMAFYEQFLGTVEAGRGKGRLSVKKARETEADTYIGAEAVARGLADAVGSLDEVLADLSRPARANSNQTRKGATMERTDLPNAGATDTAMQAARLEGEAAGKIVGKAEGIAEGTKAGADGERTRIAAIMALPEAEKRNGTALKLALDPAGFSAETVKGVLAGLPEDGAAPAKAEAPTAPSLEERMQGQAEIGADDGARPDAAGKTAKVSAVLSKAFSSRN